MSGTSLRRGDAVLVPFPFADLSGQKLRPAIIISADPQSKEIILSFITSVMSNRSPRGADVQLLQSDAEFTASGLKVDSLVRLDKLVTLDRNSAKRRLGAIGPTAMAKVAAALRTALAL